jgi:molybdopterin synthase sulfur carrier subunit
MITVLLFAQLQEEAGKDRLEIETNSMTIQELREKLQNQYQINGLNQAMAAINEEYALNEDTVKEGDTVAFIPPVSGG